MFPALSRRLNRINMDSFQYEGAVLFLGSIAIQYASSRSFSVNSQKKAFGTVKDSAIPKKSSIYTRTGDSGTTSLYNGERRPKTDLIFHALGNVDELNAALGISKEYCLQVQNGIDEKIIEIQSRLFDLGAAIATPINNSSEEKLKYTEFPAKHTKILESWIDQYDSNLPPLKNFILPSGGFSSTHLNMARAVCRRAERSTVILLEEGLIDKEVSKYLNRLSDFLFVAARYSAFKEGKQETIWRKSIE